MSIFKKRIKAKRAEAMKYLVTLVKKARIVSRALGRINGFERHKYRKLAFGKLKRICKIKKFFEHIAIAVKISLFK